MILPPNAFKRRLRAGESQLGLWCTLPGGLNAEVLAGAGFDWVLFDTEHSPSDPIHVLAQLQAASAYPVSSLVRPAWNDPVLIKRMLDIGAPAILVPFVQNAQEARAAVAACRYPPAGIQDALDEDGVVPGRPDDRGRGPAREGLHLRDEARQLVRRVLGVEQDPVETRIAEDLGHDIAAEAAPEPDLRAAVGERRLERVPVQFHLVLLIDWLVLHRLIGTGWPRPRRRTGLRDYTP